ncbi:hypothetical protein [Crenothrix sp.]|uniref:hypothetical protein n=1 Tax=Crenothrix sp. TaxID=3100433 RepID=UPI00374CF031
MLYAERMIIETDTAGNLKQLPKLPANSQIEAIFLVMEEQSQAVRQPHPDIAGKTIVVGDIFSSVSETDWNLPA